MRRRHLAAGAALVATLSLGGGALAADAGVQGHHGAQVEVIASGLDNPRDLAFGPGGRLYLAEAGHGGSHCISGGPDGDLCVGRSSKISLVQVARHRVRRIVTGLISTAGKDGTAATGVDGVDALGRNRIMGIETASRDIVPPGAFPAGLERALKHQLGRLIVANRDGDWRVAADVGHRDYRWSSHHTNLVPGQFPDANPYGVLALRHSRWVVDAGANTIDRVDANGRVHVVKFIPNPPASDAVPTCIDRGPDGNLYISQLTGGGNAPGSASVWKFNPWTGHLSKWATGLTAVTGCGFDGHGHFYAVELSTNGLDNGAPGTGAVVRVHPHSSHHTTIVSGLDFPGGFAARGRTLFVSNWSIAPSSLGAGSVLRITP